jgi:phosphoglycerate dehydrogenase-like enzyme
MQRMEILIYLPGNIECWTPREELIGEIKAHFHHDRVRHAASEEEFLTWLPEAEALFAWRLKEEHIEHASSLKLLHTPAAGVNSMAYEAFLSSGIKLTNSSGSRSEIVAEHALAMVLMFHRRFDLITRNSARRSFDRQSIWDNYREMGLLSSKTLGIWGLGAIGEALARKGKVLGMEVLAVRRSTMRKPIFVDHLYQGEPWEVIENSDYLVLCLPMTEENNGIADNEVFARMKDGARLINIGRGGLINREDLIEGLKKGRPAGAGLDVHDKYPLPEDDPLWEFDNVIISPHVAAVSDDNFSGPFEIFRRNVERLKAGQPLLNLVDPKTGSRLGEG